MRRVPLLALSALLLAMPMAVAAQRELPTIAGEGIRLVLDPEHGGIRRLETASGQEVALPTDVPLALYRFERSPGLPPIDATSAARFSWSRTGGAHPGLSLQWEGFPGFPALRVNATVSVERDSTTAWHIALDGIAGAGIERVL